MLQGEQWRGLRDSGQSLAVEKIGDLGTVFGGSPEAAERSRAQMMVAWMGCGVLGCLS